jgi:formimidoylglutamate deiminase
MTTSCPAFANAHSHAFQRRLRGLVQRGSPNLEGGTADSFWTWREGMYAVAAGLDLTAFEAAARETFAECLEAGYTAIGEFHYLHHPLGTSDDGLEASLALMRAARQTGIRLRLLVTAYARGGFGLPLSERQRRFETPTLGGFEALLDRLEAVRTASDAGRVELGVAIHSVRAVPRSWLGPLAALARARGLPLHVHASEQPAEVEMTMKHEGLTPIGLLDREGVLGPTCSVVHATWCDDDDLARLAQSGTTVVICPTTEGDLGDGFPRTEAMWQRGVPIAIGSDSHAVIDPLAELRTLETEARAGTGRRCVLTAADGGLVGPLLAIGGANGRRALGFAVDGHGDEVTFDDTRRFFSQCAPEDRLAAALLGGDRGLVDVVRVAGEVVVEGGRHRELGPWRSA